MAISLAISIPAFAAEKDSGKNTANNSSDKSKAEYFQKTGQIDLSDLSLSVEKNTGNLVIEQKKTSLMASAEKNELKQQLTDSEELAESLKSIIKKGKTPIAIGYTTVYLNEVADEKGTHLEPMTVAQVQMRGAGSSTTKGLLTLYTSAYVTVSGSTRYVDAYSVAHWGNGIGFPKDTPDAGEDFIALSLPPQYTLTDSSMSGTLGDEYKTDEEYSSVVYGFSEWDGELITVKPILTASGYSTSSTSRKKYVSKYVHTWASVSPCISINEGGASITLGSGSSSWQIASHVMLDS